ncbi:MAG: AraC family transcriptional regulator [Candidatus Merdivicinus sp.]|jgi:two-component system response regulator YesN
MKFLQPRKEHPKRKPKILLQFSISYLMLILIPIAMGVISYSSNYSAAKKQLLHSNSLILENAMYSLEGSLNSIQDFASTINGLNYIDKILRNPSQETLNMYDLQQAAHYLPVYNDSMQYVKSYYLYSQNNQLLFSPNQVFLDITLYYDYFWGSNEIPYEQWKEQLLDSNPTSCPLVILPTESGENSVYYQMPYVGRQVDIGGKIFFELNTAQIRNTLQKAFELGAQFFYLADSNGNILLSEGFDAKIATSSDFPEMEDNHTSFNWNGTKFLLARCYSTQYQLDFVIGIPQQEIHQSCMKSLQINLVGTLILIAVGIFLILCSYYYNQQPLTHIAYALQPLEEGTAKTRAQNGLWRLVTSVRTVTQKNANMELLLQEQEQRLREAFLIQLEFGGILDQKKLAENLVRYALPLTPESACRGIYLQIQEDLQLPIRNQLADGIEREFSSLHIGLWLDSRHVSVLYTESPGQIAEEVFKQLYYQIKEQYQLDICIYAGNPRPLLEISHSFTEARSLIQNTVDLSERFLFLNDADSVNTEGYCYTIQQEERLTDATEMGNISLIQETLQQVYQENFSHKHLSPFMKNLLFYRMLGTLFSSKYARSVPIVPPDLPKITTEEFFTYLKEQYSLLCQESIHMQEKKQNQNEQNIIAYLNDHYRDSDLSLTTLSLQFGMTEIYLSSLIRKLLGENFQVYIEKLRIRDANHLLEEQKLSISQIGSAVGYENANSFSRAYKRIMGYSPSQHIKLHSQKNS